MGSFFGGIASRLGMASWTQSGALLVGGALLVALPIIIHLFNKRRFKKVDWAAMEFLLDADRKNRRRVKFENLLLLLLRCLVVLLLALLVARPFLPTSLTGGLLEAEKVQHIVMLDDSLSMQTITANRTALDRAKERIVQLVRGLQKDSRSHSLKVILTSQPESPALVEPLISEERIEELVRDIEAIEGSDTTARLPDALNALRMRLEEDRSSINRQIYVMSDLRLVDWPTGDNTGPAVIPRTASEKGPAAILRDLAEEAQGCFVVDVGGEATSNLTITEVRLADQNRVVAGSPARFNVAVQNNGPHDVDNVQVLFSAGDGSPLRQTIPSIGRGNVEIVPFTFTFSPDTVSVAGGRVNYLSSPVEVALEEGSASGSGDSLPEDNVRYFPARISAGTPVLLVDGDLSSNYEASESFYLRRALDPSGVMRTGLDIRVVNGVEFETVTLADYAVIYLLNVYQMNESRVAALEDWVDDGGGLVFATGFLADRDFYNGRLYNDGDGLLPFQMVGIEGDEEQKRWVHPKLVDETHEALHGFSGEGGVFLEAVQVYLRWQVEVDEEKLRQGEIRVPMRLTDAHESPALVEQAFGKGRVLAYTFPLDADWTNWPDEPAFFITMVETTKYLARGGGEQGQLLVGEPLTLQIDLTRHDREATVVPPQGDPAPVLHLEDRQANGGSTDSLWMIGYDDTVTRGIYRLQLPRQQNTAGEGDIDEVMFAMNIDPAEGNLAPAKTDVLRRRWGDSVELVSSQSSVFSRFEGGQTEIWRRLLIVLVVVLCGEQFLAMWFARKR